MAEFVILAKQVTNYRFLVEAEDTQAAYQSLKNTIAQDLEDAFVDRNWEFEAFELPPLEEETQEEENNG